VFFPKGIVQILTPVLILALTFLLLLMTGCAAVVDQSGDMNGQGQSPGPSGAVDSAMPTNEGVTAGSSAPSDAAGQSDASGNGAEGNSAGGSAADDAWRIRVIGPTGEEIISFTEAELGDGLADLAGMSGLSGGIPVQFRHIYSTVNNWPTSRFYAVDGYSVASILMLSGLYESAQTVTFRADDGYQISLTRDQLLAPQYYYPHVLENADGAEPVYPVIAYRWREGSGDLSSAREDNPCLIFGQRNPFEHTNPAFVENVTEIIVSGTPCEAWPAASTFPLPGPIAAGETVKLQHPDYGLVKLHYTLDGSQPTMLSPMYNPSTYQPELNVPIPIIETTVIKVLVCGYGKTDSEIAVFEFIPQE